MIEVMFRVWQTGPLCCWPCMCVSERCTPVNCEQQKELLIYRLPLSLDSGEKCVAAASMHSSTWTFRKKHRKLLSPVHHNGRIEWNCRRLCYISILITDEQQTHNGRIGSIHRLVHGISMGRFVPFDRTGPARWSERDRPNVNRVTGEHTPTSHQIHNHGEWKKIYRKKDR